MKQTMKYALPFMLVAVFVLTLSSSSLAAVGYEPPEEGMVGITMVGADPVPEGQYGITSADGQPLPEGSDDVARQGNINDKGDNIRYLTGGAKSTGAANDYTPLIAIVSALFMTVVFFRSRRINA